MVSKKYPMTETMMSGSLLSLDLSNSRNGCVLQNPGVERGPENPMRGCLLVLEGWWRSEYVQGS